MDEFEKSIKEAVLKIKESKERKFNQTVDLIVNLQKFDVKKNPLNLFITVPHKIKDKKIAGFFESKNELIDTVTKDEFRKYTDKKALKKLIESYDFFIAQSNLMPQVATTFGRALGPAGKMPSPQMGIILNADDKTIKDLRERINNTIKTKVKESSIKIPIGKQDMKEEDLVENIISAYNSIIKDLPRDKDNVKNLMIKLTMGKPVKIILK